MNSINKYQQVYLHILEKHDLTEKSLLFKDDYSNDDELVETENYVTLGKFNLENFSEVTKKIIKRVIEYGYECKHPLKNKIKLSENQITGLELIRVLIKERYTQTVKKMLEEKN